MAAAAQRGLGVEDFYRSRDNRPLWFQAGRPSHAARELIAILESASVDGLEPQSYKVRAIAKAVERASDGDERAVRKADILLSRAFVDYVRDVRNAPTARMRFIDPRLRPGPPAERHLLEAATKAPSLTGFVSSMGWMNPAYAPLRRALASGRYEGREAQLLRVNLERARVLPSNIPRYVIVNAAEQRLHMYENGRVVDSMRVVVGKQKDKDRTPMMASFLTHASLNPYWNVPPDLAAERIAPNVLKGGIAYLKRHGYQVLSDWSDDATLVDPESIDWQAVADGTVEVRLRQVPGPGNSLGKVKYTFPNPYGVYLHDTPDKELLSEETRLFSGGCIRLEDAARFGEWLYGKPLKAQSNAPDIEVPLDDPVPVYVTYLTAVPSGSSIAFFDDVYGWDEERLAEMSSVGGRVAAR